MKSRSRVILIDENRYSALLAEQEIDRRYPDGIVSVFRSARSALEELTQNRYDVAIVDYGTVSHSRPATEGADLSSEPVNPDVFFEMVGQMNGDLPVILMIQPGSREFDEQDTSSDYRREGIAGVIRKDPTFHKVLPGLISKVLGDSAIEAESSDDAVVFVEPDDSGMVCQVAGKLAHEVNNPLMTILGMTELLLDDRQAHDAEVVKKLKVIRRSARRIVTSLTRLSNLSDPGPVRAQARRSRRVLSPEKG